MNRAIIPPNLLGILRKIAYANRKYHSGWMWMGVLSGLAGIKFSGSVEIYGEMLITMENINKVIINPKRSFDVKNGWNWILSLFIEIFTGFDDPFVCKVNMWMIVIAVIMNGSKKCSEKKRVSVGALTENPPHSHFTIIFPQIGIADSILVITVAAQNDIWPHGKTYPRNAVAIRIIIIITPEFQVCDSLNELIRIFFPICI